MVARAQPDLWTLALERQQLDPSELADAIRLQVHQQPLDFRTRLLIRDGINALRHAWGEQRTQQWLSGLPEEQELNRICQAITDPAGFPSLTHRLMEPTRIDTVVQFLRELGQSLKVPARITIGGSIALILPGALSRHTEDIDVVDEVPIQIRSEQSLLESLAQRYALRLTHFQSHYLPGDWESRVRAFGTYDRLDVQLIDTYDIIAGKVFSNRDKDRDDLRALVPHMDKQVLIDRVRDHTASLRAEPRIREAGEMNWYVLFGEALPAV